MKILQVIQCWWIRGGDEGAVVPPFFLVFSRYFCIMNTPTMLYAACPEKWSFHSGMLGGGTVSFDIIAWMLWRNHLNLYIPLYLMPEHSRTLPEDWSQSLWQKNNTTRAPLNCAKSSRTLSRRWKSAKDQQQQEIITKSLQAHVPLTKIHQGA